MRIHYQKQNNLNQLHVEILAAVPEVAPVKLNEADQYPTAVMIVEGLNDDVWLTIPDDILTDEVKAKADAVVAAHVA